MKRMLINATQEEELRMAMVDGQRLFDLNIEGPASERKKANIYKGKITRIEPSLEAAFVDYGADRHGFLPLKEVSSEYFVKNVDSGTKPNIREVLKEGQDIVVQIDKEERGNKGAALTTYVSLAGRFIVLKPNKARSGGVSRRIVGSDRDLARQSLSGVEVPDGMSIILRTAGIDRSAEELAWDLENLLAVWHAILNVVLQRPSPFLIYRESNAVVRALRDYLTNEIGEILMDDEATYKEAVEFVEQVMPHNLRKLKLYSDPVPLFTRFQIESQIESAFAHNVTLPSGGSIVIDHTEALVSIDINSARATKGGDIEATALNTNLEAADEIARQLRIRDLGGLIVIDFIDMGPQKNQRAVENRLREAVRQDRARVQIGKISRFGLLEMSRQRLRPSLGESSYQTCPRCTGFGTIRSVESLALAILRIVGEEARKERTVKVIAQLPVEVATYLLNEKRDWVQSLETRHDTQVILVANSALETPHYDVRRVRDDQVDLPENAGVSYALAEAETELEAPSSMQERKVAEPAAIGKIEPTTPAPKRQEPAKPGFWDWLKSLFGGDGEQTAKKKTKARKTTKKSQAARRSKKGGQAGTRDGGKPQRGRRSETRKDEAQRGQKKKTTKQTKKKTAGKDAAKSRNAQKPAPQTSDTAGDESREDGKRGTRTRRSRGGRRRRRSGDKPVQDSQSQAGEQTAEASQDAVKPQVEAVAEKEPGTPGQPQQRDDASTAGSSGDQATRKKRPPKAKADKERAAGAETTGVAAAAREPRAKDEALERRQEPDQPAIESAKPAPEGKPETKPRARAENKAESEDKPETKPRARAESKPEPKPDAGAEGKPEAKSGNGSDDAKPAAKPAGRLLPWEPAHLPAEIKKDKPAEPKRKADAGGDSEPPSESG
ncbi:MAG: Rne/Rng family ribonuclease [Gammaproteobacteria bacterium]|nr:Rne/Rng family ribonuclease [Gammaproteobacteria bacterium]